MTTRKKQVRRPALSRSSRRKAHRRADGSVDAGQFLDELLGPLTFGTMIRAIREGEEWSQSHLGELLGMSKQHISEVEHDRKSVSPERAAAWARTLGYSEKVFVELALQGELERADLSYVVHLEGA